MFYNERVQNFFFFFPNPNFEAKVFKNEIFKNEEVW